MGEGTGREDVSSNGGSNSLLRRCAQLTAWFLSEDGEMAVGLPACFLSLKDTQNLPKHVGVTTTPHAIYHLNLHPHPSGQGELLLYL